MSRDSRRLGKYVAGMPIDEIAVVEGVTAATVRDSILAAVAAAGVGSVEEYLVSQLVAARVEIVELEYLVLACRLPEFAQKVRAVVPNLDTRIVECDYRALSNLSKNV